VILATFRLSRLSGIKPKLNEELNIHGKGVATKKIENFAMEGFMPSIPVNFFGNEDICAISKQEVGNRPNEQAGGWGIKTSYNLGVRIFFCQC